MQVKQRCFTAGCPGMRAEHLPPGDVLMNVVETAKQQAKQIIEKVANRGDTEAGEPKAQAITIAASPEAITELFHDAERLSVILGDLGSVQSTGPERLRWTFP